MTLRQRHADRTRAAIVSAALELFRERSFHGTTIDEIAERADVGPRTFFRYFPTKEAVLFADAVAQRERNPAVWAYERTMLEADLAETLAGFVADRLGVSADADPRPRVWAALVMTTFRIAFHLWLDSGQKGQLRQGVQRALAAAGEATGTLRRPPSR